VKLGPRSQYWMAGRGGLGLPMRVPVLATRRDAPAMSVPPLVIQFFARHCLPRLEIAVVSAPAWCRRSPREWG